MDVALVERTLTEQVISRGVPVVDVRLDQDLAGKHRIFAWSADRVMDNGRVLGVLSHLRDITEQVRATTALRQANDRLQQANARLDLLQRSGSQIGTTLDIRRTAGELADLAVPELADRIAIDLLEQVLQGESPPQAGSGIVRFRRVALRDRTRPKINFGVGDLITVPVTRLRAAPLLRGETLLARNPAELSGQAPYPASHVEALLSHGLHTAVVVPLIARGVTLGLAAFSRAEHPEPYDEADMRLLSDLASRAAVHIDNARLYTREHATAVTLQRSLLPKDIPQVTGLQVAYRYQPASQAAEVGGDWFDVIPLDDGQVVLVVGDVTGHGIHAAAIMGQLRTATAALARLGRPPEETMAQLSRIAARRGDGGDETGATCLYAVYDPASRRCRFTSAGHLPPALRDPGGGVEFIAVPGGVMLGMGTCRYPATDIQVPPGSVLALYTDGLIERPGQDITTGMSRLARALAASPARSLEHLCDSVLTSLEPHTRDDTALLLARTAA
jgi:GAF domain-containing protein